MTTGSLHGSKQSFNLLARLYYRSIGVHVPKCYVVWFYTLDVDHQIELSILSILSKTVHILFSENCLINFNRNIDINYNFR